MRLLILPVLMLALTAGTCAPKVRSVPVPREYLACAPLPDAPDLPPLAAMTPEQFLRDQLTLGYVAGLRTAYSATCANVQAIKAWNDTLAKGD